MQLEEIRQRVAAYDGVLVLAPHEGDGSPEIAWGDLFFYYAPDGEVPAGQPFATVTTKDYPDEPAWWRGPGSVRVNVAVAADTFAALLGPEPDPQAAGPGDLVEADRVAPNPSYGSLGWISVVDPGERTTTVVRELLEAAYADARRRAERRDGR